MHEHPFPMLVQVVLLAVYSCTYMVDPWRSTIRLFLGGAGCLIN